MASRVRAVVWSESAQRALDEVIQYIANDSTSAAGHVLEAALDVAASLATLSERGRVVPELDDPAIREVFVFRYRLMYRVEESARGRGSVRPRRTRLRAVAHEPGARVTRHAVLSLSNAQPLDGGVSLATNERDW